MRWVDHWVGLPLCFCFGLASVVARKIFGSRKRIISGQGTLAVFKFFGMGSIIQASPLLRAIRQRYPEARLVFVTFKSNEELVSKLGICDAVRVIRTSSPFSFAVDVIRQILWLRFKRVEAVIDLEFFSKFSTLLSFATRTPIRVGFHLNDFWRHSLITHPIYFNYFRHISDVYEQAGRRIDVVIEDKRLSLIEPGEECKQSVSDFMRNLGGPEGTLLLGVNINAGALSLERRWPLENWGFLIESLLDRYRDMRIILTGSKGEKEYVESFVKRFGSAHGERLIITAGSWSLMEFVAGLESLDGFVTNDSGPMHFAAMQGVPTVSLWGPGRPHFYEPKVSANRSLYADYPCSPCLYMFTTFEGMWCNHEGWCMQALKPEEVLEAVEDMLGDRGKGPSV